MTATLYILFSLAALTASFDLVGSFTLAGGNLRLTNLVMLLFGAAGVLYALARGVPRIRAFGWIVVWSLANAVCMINAPAIFRTYAYTIWLAVDVLFIFSLATVFRGERRTWTMLTLNYWSYAAIALCGLLQFALFCGGIDILVKQRWTSTFPRINGFSYEPSYYATYLIVGWTMALYFLLNPAGRIGRRQQWLVFGVCTLALLLSTSRLGYFGMATVLLIMAPKVLGRLWAAGRSGVIAVLALGALAGLGTGGVIYSLRHTDPTILLEGTGLAGTHAHSVNARTEEFLQYWRLIQAHPFRGYSLGGIAGVAAGAGGAETVDYESLRKAQGINVSFEIILAAGALGAPLFFIYFFQLTAGLLGRAFAGADPDLVVALKANAWGLLMQFLLLQFNQNILRNYFWIQLAVVSCLATEVFAQCRAAARYQAASRRTVVTPTARPADGELVST